MAYAERLEKLDKLIKKRRQWEGSTQATLKDREGLNNEADFAQSSSVFY